MKWAVRYYTNTGKETTRIFTNEFSARRFQSRTIGSVLLNRDKMYGEWSEVLD